MKNFMIYSFLVLIFIVCSGCENVKTKPDILTDKDSTGENDSDNLTDDDLIDDKEQNNDEINFPDEESDDSNEEIPDDIIYETPVFISGFIEIEPNSYTFNNKNYSSGGSRIWYSFQPADENPEDKPLFVFFNGGPGSSSAILFAYNTSKMTGDQAFSEEGVIENPYSWTTMGNLLYIDARQTGFSYGLTENPQNDQERNNGYTPAVFNVFNDAADFIRVILRVLSQNPSIKANPVILVGQSYGGTRVTAMLNILLNVRDYSDGKRFYIDNTLFDEIDKHYRKIYPEMSALPHKEVIKKQFPHQILIQPLVAGNDQFNASGLILEKSPGPMYEIEAETGIKFNPCNPYSTQCRPHNNALNYVQKAGRDIYKYREKYNWLFEYVATAGKKITDIELMEELMLNDPREISWMYAKNRRKAYRFRGFSTNTLYSHELNDSHIPQSIRTEIEYNRQYYKLMQSDSLEEIFGELEVYDQYYIGLNSDVTGLFYYFDFTPYSKGNGDMFLENIKDVETFITNAEEDIVIYSPGIPPSLLKYDIVESVTENQDKFSVKFKDGIEIEILFPYYPATSHSVSINQPQKFYEDVKNWLEGE